MNRALKPCASGHAPDIDYNGGSTSIFCAIDGCTTPLSLSTAGANHEALAVEAWNALQSIPERRDDGSIKWAQPGDIKNRVWILRYDDPDRSTAYFDGPDAEEMARDQYERSWPNWNCYLLATVPHKIGSRLTAPGYDELKAAAMAAVTALADWCHNEEAKWSGWGDQIIPQSATDRTIQAVAVQTLLATQNSNPAAAEPARRRFAIDHDGFVGTEIGSYTRLDGKHGVVLQQDGTNVCHLYGEKWLKPAPPLPGEPK